MAISAPVLNSLPHKELTENAIRFHDPAQPDITPADAASLIIIQQQQDGPRLLMGRRHMKHKFMPGMFVFPGGRLDATDSDVPYLGDLHPDILAKLRIDTPDGTDEARLRGLVTCAIRETYEEAGLFLGARGQDERLQGKDWQAFMDRAILPDLSPFVFLARAVTPPGRTRRFDTRFFAVDASHIIDRMPEGIGPSGELEDLHWVSIPDAHNLELPRITLEILAELEQRLAIDPDLKPSGPVPYFYMTGDIMYRAEI